MKLLILRPYYGITVNSDMQGDLGVIEYSKIVFPDLSFVYAATIASHHEFVDLDVIDANSDKKFFEEYEVKLAEHYDYIILKAAAPTVKCDIALAKRLRKKYPKAKIGVAGHIVKLIEEWLQENLKEIDILITEPLENYVYKLVNNVDTEITIDDLPTPDFTLFHYKNFVDGDGHLRACLHMCRGCAVGCSYCPYASFYGEKFEHRSMDKVMEDIKSLLNIGVTFIQFRDQFFSCIKERVVEFCNWIIRENLKFSWTCETKIESLTPELADLMKKAGLVMVCFGVESASQDTLKLYHRPEYSKSKLKKLISYINSIGVNTLAFYIIGFPDDSWETIAATYQLARYLDSTYARFSIYTSFLQNENEGGNLHQLTPDSFTPFANTLNINACKNLSASEIKYLSNVLMIMYHSASNGFADAYNFHYLNQKKYEDKINKLSEAIQEMKEIS